MAQESTEAVLNEHLASSMSKSLRIPHVVARFLVSRGVCSVSEAHRMLCGNSGDVLDPFLMKGMDAAVEWLLKLREMHEKVFVFGDYDLDGMSAVTLMTRALAELGMNLNGDSRTALAMATDFRRQLSKKCIRLEPAM